MKLDDDAIRRLVLSQPPPLKLVRALQRIDHPPNVPLSRAKDMSCWGLFAPEDVKMRPEMSRVLRLICLGNTTPQIAKKTKYAEESVRSIRKALMGAFEAKNAAHLAALAVAHGYVQPLAEPDT